MSTIKQPKRRIKTGILVATTNKSLFNCIRTGQINVVYKYNELSHRVINRSLTTSY